MGRPKRIDHGGLVYHVLNRANARMTIFRKDSDYQAFEQVLTEAAERVSMRVLSYCIMPNHWHLVLRPRKDGDLTRFMTWLTLTHTQRWHAYRKSIGSGHVYQGRYKSFLTQSDEHFLTLCQFVEGNALRADLVDQAQDWQWSSLWRRTHGNAEAKTLLSDWPVDQPRQWKRQVNQPLSEAELESLHRCINRGRPFGGDRWVKRTVARFGIQTTTRPRGRPRNSEKSS
jgi:putative transposase